MTSNYWQHLFSLLCLIIWNIYLQVKCGTADVHDTFDNSVGCKWMVIPPLIIFPRNASFWELCFRQQRTILQQQSLSRHVPAGTCTISFIIPKNANIYVNGLNSWKILKQWWGYTHLLHIMVIIGKRWQMWWKRNNASTYIGVAKPWCAAVESKTNYPRFFNVRDIIIIMMKN